LTFIFKLVRRLNLCSSLTQKGHKSWRMIKQIGSWSSIWIFQFIDQVRDYLLRRRVQSLCMCLPNWADNYVQIRMGEQYRSKPIMIISFIWVYVAS
jgi:hypothetical protein